MLNIQNTNRTVAKYNPFLNSAQVRELAKQGLLDSPYAPRPCPLLIANQTTATLYTYHRAKVSYRTNTLAGEWTPRLKTIPLNQKIARILLSRFKGEIKGGSQKRLSRVANGWQPRQRVAKTEQQAVYA